MQPKPAIFLDRDGVLNRIVERGGKAASPRAVDELTIEAEAGEALETLRRLGFSLFVVTNQPDVRRGLMSDSALNAIHAELMTTLDLDEIAACRHDNADACACRKPKPGMILDLATRRNVDLGRSWMIGDQDRDIACGRAAGCSTILISRPYNLGATADVVVDSLSEAVHAIADAPANRKALIQD
jgi:D-glycero-D-manno-heptose 1,7-bisphosphate phosphatase